jgi:hypothetical protein
MADIIKLLLSGTPTTLLENALELADDMKFAVMVFVTKDGQIKTEWSHVPSNLEALGAVDVLRAALVDAALGEQ